MKPDFLIIGVQKGGTSSLFAWLAQHPSLSLPEQKELHYFDINYHRGFFWYQDLFPDMIPERNLRSGEASPYYLFHPLVPPRIKECCPDVKLLILLRNPSDRAYSHYMMQRSRGIEPYTSFEDAIGAESFRLKGEEERIISEPGYISYNHQKFSYLARGLYFRQISRWLEYFPLKQFLFIQSEKFYSDPLAALKKVYGFLGIDETVPENLTPQNTNQYPPMQESTRVYLNKYFQCDMDQLAGLLGNEYAIWD
jgi:hypothetical protein